ncbi:NepR family anti-sigma factor [Methylocystis parvus]|uniref:NepR family anti-sigma factor n=1 Tax=Methylocystis parvus TaxID=134 RepID=UPI003C7714B7
MNLLELGSLLSPSDAGGARSAKPRKAYDDRAGAAVLRRAGKSAPTAALRGDQGSALLAARRKTETEDRLGRQLRDFYQKMLREPVPERLVELVQSLDEKDR